MGKRKSLNGIPGNLALSYLGTSHFYGGGYIADWSYYIARKKKVKEIEVNILNSQISPKEANIKPLKLNLNKLREVLKNELTANGFKISFIKNAILKIKIPIDDPNIKNTVYCQSYIEDKNGNIYRTKKRIIGVACEYSLNLILKGQIKEKKEKKEID